MELLVGFIGLLLGYLSVEWIFWSTVDVPFVKNIGAFKFIKANMGEKADDFPWWYRLPCVSVVFLHRVRRRDSYVFVFSLLLEVLMMSLFAYHYAVMGSPTAYWFWQVLTVMLLLVAFYDLAYRLIPEVLLWIMVAFVFFFSFYFSFPLEMLDALLGCAVVGGLVFLFYFFTGGKGIGGADVYVSAIVGLMYGWSEGLLVFSLANILGVAIILPLSMWLGKNKVKQVPLVFFLVLAIYLESYFLITDEVFRFLAL